MNPFFDAMIKQASVASVMLDGARKIGRTAVTGAGKALETGGNLAHKALYVPNGSGGKRLSLTRTVAAGAGAYLGLRAVKSNSDYQQRLSRNYGENRSPSGINPTFGAGK